MRLSMMVAGILYVSGTCGAFTSSVGWRLTSPRTFRLPKCHSMRMAVDAEKDLPAREEIEAAARAAGATK